MTTFRQHGCNVTPLSEVVDTLMAVQHNSNRSYYMSTMIHAKQAWKDLLRTTIFTMRNMVLPVTGDHVVIPKGVDNVYALSYVDDCGNMVPLSYNPNINTLSLTVTESSCACERCHGNGTLCGMMDNIIYRTEPIEVDGQEMFKRIWNRTDISGNVYETAETPVVDPDTGNVIYISSHKLICKVEVNSNGCIKDTPENHAMIMACCGCYMLCNCCDGSRTARMPTLPSLIGEWNWDAMDGQVIRLRGVAAKSLIVTCQATDQCAGGDMLVPDFALDTVMFCIQYRQQAFAPSNVVSTRDKEYSYRQYRREKDALLRYLYPIDMQAFAELGSIIPKW